MTAPHDVPESTSPAPAPFTPEQEACIREIACQEISAFSQEAGSGFKPGELAVRSRSAMSEAEISGGWPEFSSAGAK